MWIAIPYFFFSTPLSYGCLPPPPPQKKKKNLPYPISPQKEKEILFWFVGYFLPPPSNHPSAENGKWVTDLSPLPFLGGGGGGKVALKFDDLDLGAWGGWGVGLGRGVTVNSEGVGWGVGRRVKYKGETTAAL